MEDSDFWSSDEFEDSVTRATIALYESEVRRIEADDHPNRVPTQHDWDRARKSGLFVPAPGRLVSSGGIDGIDGVPTSGCLALPGDETPGSMQTYCQILEFRRRPKLPVGVFGQGIPYEVIRYWPPRDHSPVEGIKFQFVLNGARMKVVGVPPKFTRNEEIGNTPLAVECAMQFLADSRHTWTIAAKNGVSEVRLGAYHECVKSLLYARQLPVTEAGRKRPILHLVRAHRRRMKEGLDIDVRQFLRGAMTVVMAGATYTVQAPQAVVESLRLPA